MRKIALVLLIGCFLALPAVAQRGGGGHGGGGGGHGGGHGGGGGFHGGMGGFHGGGFGGPGFRGGFRGGFFPRNRFVFGFGSYPWGYWPYYSAGWSYPYSDYPNYDYPYSSYLSSSASSPIVIYPSQPPVTASEAPARPEIHEYPETFWTQRDEKPIYLIAFKGQSNISAAQTYWVTGNTLHFVTVQGEAKQAPIDSIDRALTSRLNRDRHVDFRLPAEQ
jgi:hypothetical protein